MAKRTKKAAFSPIIKIAFIIALLISQLADAQKLPNKQEGGVLVPANLKIDGKLTAWSNNFHAYNKNVEVYYTIANDDDNLFLLVKTSKIDIIGKILIGGITFSVNSSGSQKTDGPSITFPIIERKSTPTMGLKNKGLTSNDTAKNRRYADSVMRNLNEQLAIKSKEIMVTGVKAIPDTFISVYNEESIKASALFDTHLDLVYELSVPLKYLNISGSNSKFSYHLQLNGAAANNSRVQLSSSGRFYLVSGGGRPSYAIPATGQNISMSAATDFWGEYTLAKK